VPKTVAPGKPWVFRADAITRDAVIDQALLARGFHIVIPPLTAQSGAVHTQWNNAHQLMTDHGFSKKPAMEGTGTAAGEAYAWAIENPDKVAWIVGRNPALRGLMSKTSPLANLSPLAKAGVPLLHVCDKTDQWFSPRSIGNRACADERGRAARPRRRHPWQRRSIKPKHVLPNDGWQRR